MIINAGIIKVVHRGDFDDKLALKFLQEAGIEIVEKIIEERVEKEL
jgi:dCMP deaminase